MIRKCELRDIGFLFDVTKKFNAEYYGVELNRHKTCTMLAHVVTTGIAYRSDTGAIIGIVMPDPFRDQTFLVELGWYSTGADGLQLLDAFEEQGKLIPVDEVRMTTLEVNARVGTLLKRRGYVPLEHSWGLKLGD